MPIFLLFVSAGVLFDRAFFPVCILKHIWAWQQKTFDYKNKTHVHGELIYFYSSTYVAYLSIQSSVYDQVYDVKHHI